jgi:hypothetical protein
MGLIAMQFRASLLVTRNTPVFAHACTHPPPPPPVTCRPMASASAPPSWRKTSLTSPATSWPAPRWAGGSARLRGGVGGDDLDERDTGGEINRGGGHKDWSPSATRAPPSCNHLRSASVLHLLACIFIFPRVSPSFPLAGKGR